MSYLNDLGIVCSLGRDKTQVLESLIATSHREYLSAWQQSVDGEKTFYCGQVDVAADELPDISDMPRELQSKNNQLAMLAYGQIERTYNALAQDVAPHRIGVIIGTSTSGIKESELAKVEFTTGSNWPKNHQYAVQEMCSPATFVAQLCGATGPVYSISTACSSSAKALASARALLDSDMVDIVICGGVDTLSHLPNNGFDSLESIADHLCNPLSAERDGINIGEGAALFIMSKQESDTALCGIGETSDAYHISAPHPDGDGAYSAMDLALSDAQLNASDIDYINLHGTGTPKNDEMECRAVTKLFGENTVCSSTKRFTGHTLGAAGAIEAGLLWLLLSEGNSSHITPVNKSDFGIDPRLGRITVSQGKTQTKLTHCLSNSFAFGGNNISVILGKTQ